MMISRAAILYLASFAAHGAMAIGIVSLKGARTYEDVAISMVESKKPAQKAEEPPPPPPPPPPKEESVKAKAAPPPKADAPPPPSAAADAPAAGSDAVPDFGLSLGGAGSSGSLALPAAAPTPSPPSSSSADRVSKKVLAAAPAPTAKEEECAEPPKKPKVVAINQPVYTTEAREAQIAGKVRVEVTVDATGKVVSARVLEGLGHGLDDAALSAAKGALFEAGTKCGKPTTATFVIAIRFAL